MPKINQAGQPSYLGVSGNVTNATGEQFELSPDTDPAETVSLDGPDQLTPNTGTDADLAGPPEDDQPVDEPVEQDEKPGNQTPAFLPKKAAPKKK